MLKIISKLLFFITVVIVRYGLYCGDLNVVFRKFGLAINFIFVLLILLLIGMISNEIVVLGFNYVKTCVFTVSSLPYLRLVFCFVNIVLIIYVLIRFQDLNHPLVNFIIFGFSLVSTLIVTTSRIYSINFYKVGALTILNNIAIMALIVKLGLFRVALIYLIAFMCFQSLILLCLGVMFYFDFDNVDEIIIGSISSCIPLVYSIYV